MQRLIKFNKYFLALLIIVFSSPAKSQNNSIWFDVYKLKVAYIEQVFDTVTIYNNNNVNEMYRFVFYDRMGRCYCERYIKNKLLESGFFTSLGNTSEILVSARTSNGKSKPIRKEQWYKPIKNGEWHIFQNGIEIKTENYLNGMLQK